MRLPSNLDIYILPRRNSKQRKIVALYINREKNSLIFDEKDFNKNFNYLPQITLALMELDNTQPIHFAIELKKTPVVFILYLRKIMQESGVNINIYHSDNSEALRIALKSYGIEYKTLKEFPG